MDSTAAASWDDDDFEPVAAAVKPSDKWEGEDEDDDVKDAWDVSSEEESSQKDDKTSEASIVKRKKKKKLADIIAEKEEARQKEKDELEVADELNKLNDTPEAKLAEKLRLQKEVEANELRLARELLGGDADNPPQGTIDAMSPETKEDFEEFEAALSEKICQFSESEHYPDCVEKLIKNICLGLNTTTLKKIKSDVEAFHSAKLKEEKAAKGGKKPAAKSKATLKRDLDRDLYGGAINDYGNDMDDFM